MSTFNPYGKTNIEFQDSIISRSNNFVLYVPNNGIFFYFVAINMFPNLVYQRRDNVVFIQICIKIALK